MIVLNRKRILFITGSVFIGLLCFTFASMSLNTNKEYIPTVNLPVSGKVVVVDAGHGVPDEGAQSSRGTTEAATNLAIAFKLQNLLESSGCTVILTRSDENAIYDIDAKTLKQKKISDIKNRVKIGNESSADIFVSIHLNKIPQPQYDGWQTFYNIKSEKGKLLAESIQNSLNNTIARKNDRLPKSINNVYIVDHVEIPLALVECGFLSNQKELYLLMQDDYQNRLAYGIYCGIIEYFNSES